MKKIIIVISGVLFCLCLYILIQKKSQVTEKATYTIGILQTASHPALDSVLQGFQQELKKMLGDTTVAYVVQNAQGSVSSAHTIAQQFHGSSKYDLFFTIATPAAQAMHAVEKERPIILAAVTDPSALGFVYAGSNVCGVTDMIDISSEVAMLHALVPDAKNIGLLYTIGEMNSLVLVEIMKSKLQDLGLNPIDFAVSGEADIQAVVELACRKSDLILAPTDNVVASTISLITMITKKYKKPLIVSDNMLVSSGALAAQGVDYYASGQQAAGCAFQLLVEHKKPSEVSIQQTKSEQIFMNKQTLNDCGLSVPAELQTSVILVG